MAKTLLESVNEVLTRVGLVSGDSGALTSLTDSARQVSIDQAVQVINEGIDELYSTSGMAQPNEQAESSFTLVTSTRAYSLASDLVQIRWPLIDKTNSQLIYEAAGGYDSLLLLDLEQDDTGLPYCAAIRPTDGKLFLDRAPTASENGRVYTYQYDKDLVLDAAADTVPFSDAVFRAMVPAWVQLWKREKRHEFDSDMFKTSVGRASRLLTQKQPRTDWSPR